MGGVAKTKPECIYSRVPCSGDKLVLEGRESDVPQRGLGL